MIVKKFKEIKKIETAHGVDVRNIYTTEAALINIITLQAGEALKRHITPVDVAFYVLEGTGIVEVGDERVEVIKDTTIESPKDIVHCWYNESESDLKIMVIKTPNPTKKSVFVDETNH